MKAKLILVTLTLYFSFINGQNNYYFSEAGNDVNSGTSESSPFKTIHKLNSLTLQPGDKIFFKRGDTFIGQIIINQSGTENNPIIFDSYGSGNLPILSGSNGDNGTPDPRSTIRIIGKEYLEFHNLRIENERFDSDGNTSNNDKSYGIYFQSFLSLPNSGNFEDRILFKHFRFSNLHFENIYSVNTNNTEFNELRSSGIHFFEAFVNDVIVENCRFTDLERVGIWMRKYASDIIVKNNKFINIGGSGAIFSQTKRVLFEDNIMRFCGSDSNPKMIGRGSGMWVFASDDVVAQYNISQHARGAGDSSGMHVDYGNTNILFQYNYLEDSAGGFCETLGDNKNIIWRYNISVNEGTDDKGGKNKLLWVNDYAGNNRDIKSDEVYIYNNTIYQGKDYVNKFGDSRIELEANEINFINNIIFLENASKLGLKSYFFDVNTVNFKRNLYFGGTIKQEFKNKDALRREINPRLFDAGRKHFSGYKLMSFSAAKADAFSFTEPSFPLAGQGIFKDITSKATKDIFGNPVDLFSATNIGAYNGSGESTSPTFLSLEAENASVNNGAIEVACENASNGKAINATTSGRNIIFDNISVSKTELYLIKVFYLNPALSKLKVTVNNGASEEITVPYTDGFCFQSGNPTSFDIVRELQQGLNSLKIEQGVIDKIELVAVNEATLDTNNFQLRPINAYLDKTIMSSSEVLNFSIEDKFSDKLNISVFDINGKRLFNDTFTKNKVQLEVSSFGKGVKIFVANFNGQFFVKKIIIR